MTRIEKIRKMTSEEMANEMCEKYDNHCPFCAYREHSCTEIDCIDGIKMWLEEEV